VDIVVALVVEAVEADAVVMLLLNMVVAKTVERYHLRALS
jgi:hypothetical protein